MSDKNELLVSTSNRNLERKIKIFGFEIFDLLIIAISLSILNLLFKGAQFQTIIVWGTSTLIALALFIGKRNKPENYLLDKVRFWIRPATYFATSFDLKSIPYLSDYAEKK